MIRPIRHIIPVAFAALFAAASFACDKPGATEQQKEDKATERANNAVATAQKDITSARTDFEQSRENYRHTRRGDLATLDKKITDLEIESRTATGKTKADLDANLPAIRAQRATFVSDMEGLDTASPATWDSAKMNLDKEWDALKSEVDKAR